MKTIKKLITVIAITFAFVTGLVVGGVQVEAITANQNNTNYGKLIKYLRFEQPAQIKRDIKKTIAYYKKIGKSYPGNPLSTKDINQLYNRYKIDKSKLTRNQKSYIENLTYMTELFLHYRIDGGGPSNTVYRSFIDQYGVNWNK